MTVPVNANLISSISANLMLTHLPVALDTIALTGDEDEILSLENDIIKAWTPVTNRKGIKKET